jgi:hypothetical protein
MVPGEVFARAHPEERLFIDYYATLLYEAIWLRFRQQNRRFSDGMTANPIALASARMLLQQK